MTDQHPMNPPTHMYDEWIDQAQALHPSKSWDYISGEIARLAYQAGADQELEACCGWVHRYASLGKELRAARRPQPPSLKEQALAVVENSAICDHLSPEHEAILRRALEALPDA